MKNVNWWTRARVALGIFILPIEAKKIVVRALNPQVMIFTSPEEFSRWLREQQGRCEIIELSESQIIEEGKVH